jgi:tape measure domain-containing protein
MTVSLGTLEIGLGLNTNQYDIGIARAKGQLVSLQRMAARSGVTVKIGVEVDDRRLYQLNDHLKLKRDDLDKTVAHYRRNPVRVYVEDRELVRLNRELRELKRVSVDIKVPSRLVVEHRFSGYQDKVEKAIERLSVTVRNSNPRGNIFQKAFNLTVGNAVEGFFTGAGLYSGLKAGKGLNRTVGIDFEDQGEAVGKTIRRNVKQFNNLLDAAFKDLLGFPRGLKGAKQLLRINYRAITDTLFNPETYRKLEDLYVEAQQFSRANVKKRPKNSTEPEPAYPIGEKLKEAFPKIAMVAEENLVRSLGAAARVAVQPLRIRKRIQLSESARAAEEIAKILQLSQKEQDFIKSRKSITLVTGGVQPSESRPGQPQVKSTYDLAAQVQGVFPETAVLAVPNVLSNSLEELKNSPSQFIREQLLPIVEKNKELLQKFMSEADYQGILTAFKTVQPIDRVAQTNFEGFDKDAITLAAKALNVAMGNPDKEIALVGGSGGGYVVEEAVAILQQLMKMSPALREMLKNVKYGLGIGTPNAGLTSVVDPKSPLKYVAAMGNYDKVGITMFGKSFIPDINSKDAKKKKAAEDIYKTADVALPSRLFFPSKQQLTLNRTGEDHKIGLYVSNLATSQKQFNKSLRESLKHLYAPIVKRITELKKYKEKLDQSVSGVDRSRLSVNDTKKLDELLALITSVDQEIAERTEFLKTIPVLGNPSKTSGGEQKELQSTISAYQNTLAEILTGASVPFSYLDPLLSNLEEIEKLVNSGTDTIDLKPSNFGSLLRFWMETRKNIFRTMGEEFETEWTNFINAIDTLAEAGYEKQFGAKPYHYVTEPDNAAPDSATYGEMFSRREDAPSNIRKNINPRFGDILYKLSQTTNQKGLPLVKDQSLPDLLKWVDKMPMNTEADKAAKKVVQALIEIRRKEAQIYQGFLRRVSELQKRIAGGDKGAQSEYLQLLKTSPFSRIGEMINAANKYVDTNASVPTFIGKNKVIKEIATMGESVENITDFFFNLSNAILGFEASLRTNTGLIESALENVSQSLTSESQNIKSIQYQPFDLINVNRALQKSQKILPENLDVLKAEKVGQGFTGAVYRLGNLAIKTPVTELNQGKLGTPKEFQAQLAMAKQGLAPRPITARKGEYFIQEYIKTVGSLNDILRKADLSTQENIKAFTNYVKRYARLLKNIHESGYAHFDLNTENVLISPENELKAIDFANATKLSKDQTTRQEQINRDVQGAKGRSTQGYDKKTTEIFQKAFDEGYADTSLMVNDPRFLRRRQQNTLNVGGDIVSPPTKSSRSGQLSKDSQNREVAIISIDRLEKAISEFAALLNKNQQIKPQEVSDVVNKQKDLTGKENLIEKTIHSATKQIVSSLSRIEKAILAKYASRLIDPWQNSTPNDPWAKSNAELMQSFVNAVNKASSQKLLPPAPEGFGISETDRGNTPLEKVLESIAIKTQAGLKSSLTTRLSTPDSSGEIQLLSGNESISDLLNQVLIREVKEASRILRNALKDTSLDIIKFGQTVFTVLKAIERPVMAIPGMGLGKKALQLGGTAAVGAAALHALPLGLDAAVINEMRTILSGAMSAGGQEMLQAVSMQMTQAFSGLPFGVGQQLTEAVMNLVTELTNGTISVLAQGGAVAGSSLMAGEGVKKLLGAATGSIPQRLGANDQKALQGRTDALIKTFKQSYQRLASSKLPNPIELAPFEPVKVPKDYVKTIKSGQYQQAKNLLTEALNMPDDTKSLAKIKEAYKSAVASAAEIKRFIEDPQLKGGKINQSLGGMLGHLIDEVKKLFDKAQIIDVEFTVVDLTDEGIKAAENLNEGLTKGLKDNKAGKIARKNAKNIIDGLNNELGNRSPSWKGEKAGRNLIKGVEIGIEKELASSDFQELAEEIVKAFEVGLFLGDIEKIIQSRFADPISGLKDLATEAKMVKWEGGDVVENTQKLLTKKLSKNPSVSLSEKPLSNKTSDFVREETIDDHKVRLYGHGLKDGRFMLSSLMVNNTFTPPVNPETRAKVREVLNRWMKELFAHVGNTPLVTLPTDARSKKLWERYGFKALPPEMGGLMERTSEAGGLKSTFLPEIGKKGIEAGKNLNEGLAKGLKDNKAEKIAYQNAIDIVNATNKGLGNQSPSRKGEKAGKNLIEGIGIGVERQESRLTTKVKELTTKVIKELQKGLSNPAVKGLMATLAIASSGMPVNAQQFIQTESFKGVTMNPATTGAEVVKQVDVDKKAFRDKQAIAYSSGPMFDRFFLQNKNQKVNMIADVVQRGQVLQLSRNRAAAEERGFIGINKQGNLKFGYGGAKSNRLSDYDTFIGGLHVLYNDEVQRPANYKGGYHSSVKQQLAYQVPRPRVFFGKTKEGNLTAMEGQKDMTPQQLEKYARSMGFTAVMLPDHGNMARLTVPSKSLSRILPQSLGGTGKSTPYQLRFFERPQIENKQAKLSKPPSVTTPTPVKKEKNLLASIVSDSIVDKELSISPQSITSKILPVKNVSKKVESAEKALTTDLLKFIGNYGLTVASLLSLLGITGKVASKLKKANQQQKPLSAIPVVENIPQPRQSKQSNNANPSRIIDAEFSVIEEKIKPKQAVKKQNLDQPEKEAIETEKQAKRISRRIENAINIIETTKSKVAKTLASEIQAMQKAASLVMQQRAEQARLAQQARNATDVMQQRAEQARLASGGGGGNQPPRRPRVASGFPDPNDGERMATNTEMSRGLKDSPQRYLEDLIKARAILQKRESLLNQTIKTSNPQKSTREEILGDWNQKRDNIFKTLDSFEEAGVSSGFTSSFVSGLKAAIAQADGFINFLSVGGKALRTLDKELDAATGGMFNLRKASLAVIGGLALFKTAEFLLQPLFFGIQNLPFQFQQAVSSSLLAFTELEQIKINLNVAGVSDVNASIDGLQDRANELGISFKESAKQYAQFRIVTMNSPLQAQSDNIYQGFQSALAVRQTSPQQQAETFRAINQMASRSVLSVEEFTQQLTESGGLYDALIVAARASGLTTAEFYRQASAGQLLTDDVIPRLSSEYERMSAGGLGAASKTLQAEINRYQNNVEQLSMGAGEKLGVVAYPALQLLNALLKGLSDNLSLVVTVGASAAISAIGLLGKAVLQFSAATRLGAMLVSSYNASLFAMGVTAGQTTTQMQTLTATAKVAGGVIKATLGAMIVPASTIFALTTFYDIFENGNAELKNSLETLKESRKVLEDLGKIKPDKNLWNNLFPDMNLSGTEKVLNVLTVGTVYTFKRNNAVRDRQENLKNIREGAGELETNLKGYQTVLSDTSGIDKFIDSLQGVRNQIALIRAERAVASGKGDSASIVRLNEQEQVLMKTEQEAIDKRFGSVGSRITADLQVAENALAQLDEEYRKSGNTLKNYASESARLKELIAGLKTEQQNYLNVLRDQEKQYKKLQYAFNRSLNAQDNRIFANARASLTRQIGNEKGFASGQLNEYEFNVKVREESLQTAKEKIASLQTTASETGAKLNTRITEAADKTLSTYFGDDLKKLGVGSFSEAIDKNLLSREAIERVMSENSDLESNAALKNILEMAQTYATTRQDILATEKEIQTINREIINERKRRQIAEKQSANEVLVAGQQEKLYNATPTSRLRSFQSAETQISLEELYKQLAVEQERLAANVDDPLPIRSNIARIKANIARTRLTLRDQQNDLAEFYATTAIEIEATNKQIKLTARTVSSQVKTFARDQTLIEISKLYKQLAFEQSKLVGTLKGDPLEIEANIARIQLQIEQAKLSLRSQTIDLEDYYTGLQRQVVDLRVSIEDYQIQSAREIRGFRESYGDMIRGLQRSLIEAENEFRTSQRTLENQRLRVSLISGRTPGMNSLQKQLDDLILQYQDEVASIQGEADSLRTRPLDIRDQSIQFARQLRNIQEQIYDAERNRLKQLRDFWNQQVQIARELSRQQLTFKSLNEVWAGILENSKKLLAKSGEIAGGKVPKIAPAIGEAPNNSESSEHYRQGTPNNPRTLQRGDYIDYGNGQIYKYDPSPSYDPKTMRYRSTVNADDIRHPSVVQQVETSGSEEFDRLLMRSGLYKNWEGFAQEVLNPNLQPLTPVERANYTTGNVERYSGVLTGQPQANIPLAPLPTFDYDRAQELNTQIRITREKALQNQQEENLLKLERARRENLDRIAGLIRQTQESRIQAEIGLRDTGDTSTDLMRSSKGYLTFSEKIEQARRNGSREIEKQRESIQSQIRSLEQLTSDFAKNSEETQARLFQDTGNDDAFKALKTENKRNTAILEGYKALDNQLATYGQIRGEAAAMRMIEDERVAALERYNNLLADGIDAGNRINPLGTLFSTGESQKLRIEADFARRRLELKRQAQEGALSPTQLSEMSDALDKMQQANLASAFIEANPAVGAFGDLLRAAFTGGRDTLQQMLNVLTSFLQKIGEMAANQLLMQIFGGSGGASSPVPFSNGGGGLLGGALSLFTGSLGGLGSSVAFTPFTSASGFSLGTGFSLFSSGGKIGADAPIEKNMISAFRRERSMSGGRNPRLIVANEDEYVLTPNETKAYLEYKNTPIKNYATGGFVGGTGYNITNSNSSSSDRSLAITNVSNITIESRNDMGYSLTQLKERENAQNERTKRRFFG